MRLDLDVTLIEVPTWLDLPTRLVEWPIILLITTLAVLSVKLGWRARWHTTWHPFWSARWRV